MENRISYVHEAYERRCSNGYNGICRATIHCVRILMITDTTSSIDVHLYYKRRPNSFVFDMLMMVPAILKTSTRNIKDN